MEIHEIRYFLTVCETLNFTRAAERCSVSQPSLTRAIQSLEAKLGGGPLINRERHNTHLTELGRLMQPYFQQMLESMDEAMRTARRFGGAAVGTLRLGMMCTIGPFKLSNLFGALHQTNPAIKLRLIDDTAASLQDQLASGELDAAIYCRPDQLDERFHVIPLYEERFVVAFGPGHDWSSRSAITFQDLHGQAYLNRISCEYNEHIDAIMAQRGVQPHYPYESERDDWIQSMVVAGLGCTTIPEFAITHPKLLWRPLVQPEISRCVNLVTTRGRQHGPAVGALVHAVKRHDWGAAPGQGPAPKPDAGS